MTETETQPTAPETTPEQPAPVEPETRTHRA